jgi:hypothetical protein
MALVLAAGCSVNTTFVYKPNAPAAGGAKLPVKIAVLPFKDGTEDFTTRGTFFDGVTYNLAKGGITIQITALTSELQAKAFADDMAASGAFRATRYIYSPSELLDEEFTIEGTLGKAYIFANGERPNEFALGLRAVRRTDGKTVWEKEVTRAWKFPNDIFEGCGLGQECKNDRQHAEINRVMQGMFAEARADLVAALAALSWSRAGEGSIPPAASPAAPASESPEQTIERILKAK